MIHEKLTRYLAGLGDLKLEEPMGRHTTFRVGGPADVFFTPRDPSCLGEVRALARENDIPFTVIGGGSNLLVGDMGIRGIVARVCAPGNSAGLVRPENDESAVLYADARAGKKSFIECALSKGLEGMEFMAGLPGCVGGGIAMNAGTNLGCFSDILTKVRYIGADGRAVDREITPEMAKYRNLAVEDGAIFLGGWFRMRRAENPEASARLIDEIIRDREFKHPLEYPSAGSVFKNPEGHSSWKLVNDAGLRGYRIGGAMVSEKHTNFIINAVDASASDIALLIRHVRETVFEKFGVSLEPEVKMLGIF